LVVHEPILSVLKNLDNEMTPSALKFIVETVVKGTRLQLSVLCLYKFTYVLLSVVLFTSQHLHGPPLFDCQVNFFNELVSLLQEGELNTAYAH
jgi:hypothetical protein